jgi:hypothetical protein
MTRAVLLALALGLLAIPAAVAALTRSTQAPPVPQNYIVQPGDTIQLAGSGLGCAATRRGGRPALECRVTNDRARTYGTFLTQRRVTVGRFVSADTAQTVFTARHRGGWRTCGTRRSARAAAPVARRQECR